MSVSTTGSYDVVGLGARVIRELFQDSGFKIDTFNDIMHVRNFDLTKDDRCKHFKVMHVFKYAPKSRGHKEKLYKCSITLYMFVGNVADKITSVWERELVMDIEENEDNFLFPGRPGLDMSSMTAAVCAAITSKFPPVPCVDGEMRVAMPLWDFSRNTDRHGERTCQLRVHFNLTNLPTRDYFRAMHNKSDYVRVDPELIRIVLKTALQLVLPVEAKPAAEVEAGDGGFPGYQPAAEVEAGDGGFPGYQPTAEVEAGDGGFPGYQPAPSVAVDDLPIARAAPVVEAPAAEVEVGDGGFPGYQPAPSVAVDDLPIAYAFVIEPDVEQPCKRQKTTSVGVEIQTEERRDIKPFDWDRKAFLDKHGLRDLVDPAEQPAAVVEARVAPPAAVVEARVAPPAAVVEARVAPPAAVVEARVAPPAAVVEARVAPPAAQPAAPVAKPADIVIVIDDD